MKIKLNKRTVAIILLVILLVAVVITAVFANARYQSTLRGTGTASIAKWSFKLVDADTQTTDVIDLAVTRTDGSDKVEEGKMAPGTYGEIEIGIDARGTEVALEYTIDVSLGNLPRNLVFYSDSAKTEVIEAENSIITKVGEMTLEEVNEVRTEKIYWDWPYQTGETEAEIITNNQEDTEDAGKDVTMQISVTGVQMLEKVLLNTAWEMSYSGQVEEFVVPAAGIYQLEVYGAQGGTGGGYAGGKGGYASGNVRLSKGTTLYVCVGGKGESYVSGNGVVLAGGYNGGGNGYWYTNSSGLSGRGAAGGGATHIGIFNSTLEDHGTTEGLYIVAGGGGGSGSVYGWNNAGQTVYQSYQAGTGGGETGGNGTLYATGSAPGGGTQTEGGTAGPYGNAGSFGKGGNHYNSGTGAGGGGGLYGGAGTYYASGAGGGSGYTGGCIEGTTQMTNGLQEGDGYAKITLISY